MDIKVCLICEEVAENTRMFIITCHTQEAVEFLKKCHNYFITSLPEESECAETIARTYILSNILSEKEKYWEMKFAAQTRAMMSQMTIKQTESIIESPDLVVLTKFLL